MNLKKKLKKFFTLKRRANDGFTLVELIVVIAILAILAGVGSAGYAGYIKAANKGNDKVLVGNIIRAIETGTYSTAFASGNSFVKGATTYPVGVVNLTTNGCDVMASTSDVTLAESECVKGTVTLVESSTVTTRFNEMSTIEKIIAELGITPPNKVVEHTNIVTKEYEYCVTHTNLPAELKTCTKAEQVTAKLPIIPIPIGKYWDSTADAMYRFKSDCTGLYTLKTPENGHVYGQKVSQENLVASDTTRVGVTTDSPIYNSLQAAFGDPSTLKLTYDGWGSQEGEGHTYATMLTYTSTLMEDIDSLASALIAAGSLADGHLAAKYENAADMVDSFSNYMTELYPSLDSWMPQWNGAGSANDVQYHFGFSGAAGSGKDYIYAARTAYNTAFASYCDANGIADKYTEVLKDYHHTASGILSIPDTITPAAFATKDASNSDSLYAQFLKADKTNGEAEFDKCAALYQTYKNSEACRKNGETFYNTMKTVAVTGAEAYKNGKGGKDGYFAYYTNLMNEMAAYYDYIDNHDGKGILILVTVENGVVKCEVSPSSANPRND